MALSWFFSGKKKEEKPVTVEAIEVGSDEDYAIIQANTSGGHTGIYPQVPQAPYPYTPLPYSMLPQRQDQKITGNSDTRTTGVQNQLEGVPFVLSPNIEQNSVPSHLAGMEDLRRAVFQIAADINDSVFDYNFQLEISIMREATEYKPAN